MGLATDGSGKRLVSEGLLGSQQQDDCTGIHKTSTLIVGKCEKIFCHTTHLRASRYRYLLLQALLQVRNLDPQNLSEILVKIKTKT